MTIIVKEISIEDILIPQSFIDEEREANIENLMDSIEKEGLLGKHIIPFYTHAPYNYEDYFQSKSLGKELSLDYLLDRIEDLL